MNRKETLEYINQLLESELKQQIRISVGKNAPVNSDNVKAVIAKQTSVLKYLEENLK